MTTARIAHIALWTRDIERLCAFYTGVFGLAAGPPYESARRPGFLSRFLAFADGTAIELMQAPWLEDGFGADERIGYAHIAIGLGSEAAIDALSARAQSQGFLHGSPRHTGDGFYEAVLTDPDGNLIEITV